MLAPSSHLLEMPSTLTHPGELLKPPSVSPVRGSPVAWDDLVQPEDDHWLHQASPEDVPIFDIHRR